MLEGAKGKFGVAGITEGDGFLRVAADGDHDKAARLAPVTGLLITMGFGFGGGHCDRQWSV